MNKVFLLLALLFCWPTVGTADETDWIYTTRPGDTLSGISQQYLKNTNDWQKIQKHNKIKSPRYLQPGTRLLIPTYLLKLQPTPAIVESIIGHAQLTSGKNNKTRKVNRGDKLFLNDNIVTAKTTSVVLKFADGSRLTINAESSVTMDTLSANGKNGMADTRLRLQYGRTQSNIIPMTHPNSRFEIITPAAVASVRGTKFRTGYFLATASMISEVLEGKIIVKNDKGSQQIPAGFGLSVRNGEHPGEPSELLAAPDLTSVMQVYRAKKIQLQWPKIAGARSYYVFISQLAPIKTTLFDQTLSNNSFEWLAPNKGKFGILVLAINNSGLNGLESHKTFQLIDELHSAKLIQPAQQARIKSRTFSFQWLGHADVKRFKLQVASNPQFNPTLIEVSGNQQFYSTNKTYQPGIYYWRIANLYEQNQVGEYSPTQSFTLVSH